VIQYFGYDYIEDVLCSYKTEALTFKWEHVLYLRRIYPSDLLYKFYLRNDLKESELFKELTQ